MAAGDIISGDQTNKQPAFKEVATRDGKTALAALVSIGEGGAGTGASTETTASIGYRQLDDDDLMSAYTMTGMPTGAQRVVIESNAIQAVRWRDDGPAPTPSTGRRITRDRTLDYRGDLSKLKFIAEGTGAVLDLTFYV